MLLTAELPLQPPPFLREEKFIVFSFGPLYGGGGTGWHGSWILGGSCVSCCSCRLLFHSQLGPRVLSFPGGLVV